MSEMVTRVAKAMADAVAMNYDHNEQIFKLYARAAIEAMREPTNAMTSSADELSVAAEATWGAMIDSALT